MIRYEVKKDAGVEIVTECRRWTSEELQRDYNNRSAWYSALLKTFDTLEEAIKYFDQEKEYCTTERWNGFGNIRGIHYDVLSLDEAEYDDDGEFISSTLLNNYIAPYSEDGEDDEKNHSLDGWERYYIKEAERITTWKDALINSLLSWESQINEIVSFDTKNRCFNVSSNPLTYKDINESAEMDAFEEYPNLPEWDDNNKDLEIMFREYLVEIKSICEKWERHIMCRATEFDKSDGKTATEYFTSFFNQFWGRS